MMDIALWIGQGILAVIFTVSGTAKLTKSKQRLIDSGQTGVVFLPLPAIRVVASLELLGVLGVILPWLTGIRPGLTPLAAMALRDRRPGRALPRFPARCARAARGSPSAWPGECAPG